MKTILHPTDFSENAISALKYAHMLSKKMEANLYVIHIFNASTLSSDLNETYLLPFKETFERKSEKLKKYCETNLDTLSATDQLKTEAIENANTVTGIIAKANEINASLIVVGMKGKNTLETIFIGSTTNKLIKKSPFPTLVIPPNTLLNRLETIVYATDFEEEDISAIFKLSQIAQLFNATIKIVHISLEKNAYTNEEMDWFKELLLQKVTYTKLKFELISSEDEDTFTSLRSYLIASKADLLAMLEREEKNITKQLFHRDLVKRMESLGAIPLISYNEINY